MASTTIKVTPTSRGNFSKLRKFQSGGFVEKYAEPSQGLHSGVTHNEGSTWRGDIFSKYLLDIQNELAAAKTPELKLAVIKKYNDAQTKYAAIRSGIVDLSKVRFDLHVKDYQDLINSGFKFVNTNGIKNGHTIGRYNYLAGDRRFATGDRADSWNSDGWWGGLTLDRTTLGYRGDWDEKSNEYKGWLDQLGQYDMETFLDVDGAYKLRLKQNPDPLQLPNPEPDPLPGTETTPDKALEFEKGLPERLSSPWTDWLPLTANYINDRINNRRLHDLETKKKFPLQQAVELNALLTDGYLGQQLRSKIAAETRSRANLNLSSNMEYNLASINLAEDRANQLEEQNAVDKNTIYDKSRENLNNIAFGNKQRRTTTANYNAALEALAFNNLITADQKLSTANTAALNSYNTNRYVSHGLWLQNERMEDAAYLKKVLDYKYQQDALKLYADSGLEKIDGPDGKYNSKAFEALCAELEADNENGPEAVDGNITPEVIRDWAEEHQNDPRVLAFERAFEKEYNATNSAYEKALQKLQADSLLAGLSQRETVSNLGFRIGNNFSKHRQTNPLYAKEGGKAARFLDYMEHYRKSQDSVAKINSETQKQLRKLLDRDLGILDKETLMLLKYAFS